ncbi:glycosyltransferase involved in cell wall biosynthesis [Hymenobacter luteus]|uniref:Glycosyltransferase involved in cell wall biosynthesis n=2 Tax=Hymenobacter TaxID=89966 RepID=A0A7W9SZ43_9BACT|nr:MULTISPECIES: glycosyltransferase [Hymenobacter]MBB4599836.1 glycosyltransferase involved in cell wall biosynthesis [Hymenobacter latericoloratus]MBB6057854.1 glycosyltransferase involved in cell wall biosynthesis [Hymenobacter luteus]
MPKLRVLHLPKWYPHRYDDQDGDFVARHVAAIAQATGPAVETAVLLATVARGPLARVVEWEEDLAGPVPTLRYYYRQRLTGIGPLDKLLKLGLYFWCLSRGYRRLLRYWGAPPDLVHVHVLLRTGLWAWWQRLRHGIPYLITEHWTLYLPARAGHIGWLRQLLTRWVVGRAAALHTVSENLRDAMHGLGFRSQRSAVIANVVDTDLFQPTPTPRVAGQLLVVSAFHDSVKNISGILRVVARLRPHYPHLRLRLAGYGPDETLLRRQAAELGLLSEGTVTFLGKLAHPAVAAEMQRAAALVSFSRAETFGCVLLEARATGCPVVGPATGGVPELFQPAGRFGLLVPPDDEAALAEALTAVLQQTVRFEAEQLRADAVSRCSYLLVGQAFYQLYATLRAGAGPNPGESSAS